MFTSMFASLIVAAECCEQTRSLAAQLPSVGSAITLASGCWGVPAADCALGVEGSGLRFRLLVYDWG